MDALGSCLDAIGERIREVEAAVLRDRERFDQLATRHGEWTSAQLFDHLAQVHVAVLGGIGGSSPMPKCGLRARIMRAVVTQIMCRAIKVPAPAALPRVGAGTDPAPAVTKLNDTHAELLRRCAAPEFNPEALGLKHPIAGPLTQLETLQFLRDHLVYHAVRAGRVARMR